MILIRYYLKQAHQLKVCSQLLQQLTQMTEELTQEELRTKLNTSGAFDSKWLRDQLEGWNIKKEQEKADFTEHLYQVYNPRNGLYTGLWERFCLTEAGPYTRDKYFDMLKAVKDFEENKLKEATLVAD